MELSNLVLRYYIFEFVLQNTEAAVIHSRFSTQHSYTMATVISNGLIICIVNMVDSLGNIKKFHNLLSYKTYIVYNKLKLNSQFTAFSSDYFVCLLSFSSKLTSKKEKYHNTPTGTAMAMVLMVDLLLLPACAPLHI